MRFAKRNDQNHTAIIDALRKHGVQVEDLSGNGNGVCDLVTHYKGMVCFIELKYGKRAELKKSQVKFLSEWRGFCGIASNFDEAYALAIAPAIQALTPRQKDKLAAYLVTMTAKKVHLPTILKVIQ